MLVSGAAVGYGYDDNVYHDIFIGAENRERLPTMIGKLEIEGPLEELACQTKNHQSYNNGKDKS